MKIVTGILATIMLLYTVTGCKKDSVSSNATQGSASDAGKGISTAMPAYYDSSLYKILFVEFSSNAEATLIAKNPNINFIYQSDPGLPGGLPFISVIDAIPGDGMNPIWREVQIMFNPGFTPRQLYRDDAVLAAASGPNPEITLDTTNEVYWCPVIGKK